jgi:hypothetical protein
MKQAAISAADRLGAAKVALTALDKEIDAAIEARRRAVLDDDNDDVAAALDRKLAGLRLRRQRCVDKIEWLPRLVTAEESEAAWPGHPDALRSLIDSLSRQLFALQAKPRIDRSAVDDAAIDSLTQRVPALTQRLQQMTKFFEASHDR